MRQIFIYSILFIFCLYLGSCKSSRQIPKKNNLVCVEDFHSFSQGVVGDSKAVKLSEIVDVRMESLLLSPWAHNLRNSYWMYYLKWITEVEDKILFEVDSVNSEPFCNIRYFNPSGMRWNLMTQCNMWLYTLYENGKISRRRIKRDEIIHERLNDSICNMRLNIHENVFGKILVRKYTLLTPYYSIKNGTISSIEPSLNKIEPWIFQKDIPLLYGKYEIRLPEGGYEAGDENGNFIISEVVKLGNEKMNIQSGQENVTLATKRSYKATKVTATVTNVTPLPEGSKAQPLGIEITRDWE